MTELIPYQIDTVSSLTKGEQIAKDSSIIITGERQENGTVMDVNPIPTHHYVSVTANTLGGNNNNFIGANDVFQKGRKSFDKDTLKQDLLVTGLRLKYDAAVATEADLLTADFAEDLPASTRYTRLIFNQGANAIHLLCSELKRGNSTREGDFYTLPHPINIRKDIPFSVTFEMNGGHAAADAYRLEFQGFEKNYLGTSNRACATF